MTTQDQPRNDLALAEAALFLTPQPLTRRALAAILGGVALTYVDQLLEDLREQFRDPGRGIELHIEDGRAMFRVKAAYVNQVAHLAPQQDIPKPTLRTLAVIAYNNPMTQSDLIKIRGNKGYGHVQDLLERNLIASEEHGRTLLLSVTKEFLRHFGLSSVEEFRFHFAASPEDAQDGGEDPQQGHTEEAESERSGGGVDDGTREDVESSPTKTGRTSAPSTGADEEEDLSSSESLQTEAVSTDEPSEEEQDG